MANKKREILYRNLTTGPSDMDLRHLLRILGQKLAYGNSKPLTENNTNTLPEAAGVYLFWFSDKRPIYIGQTDDIRTRLNRARTGNHTFRRKIAHCRSIKYAKEKGKGQLSLFYEHHVRFSYIEIAFGRLEIEEWLIQKWQTKILNGHRLQHIPTELRRRVSKLK